MLRGATSVSPQMDRPGHRTALRPIRSPTSLRTELICEPSHLRSIALFQGKLGVSKFEPLVSHMACLWTCTGIEWSRPLIPASGFLSAGNTWSPTTPLRRRSTRPFSRSMIPSSKLCSRRAGTPCSMCTTMRGGMEVQWGRADLAMRMCVSGCSSCSLFRGWFSEAEDFALNIQAR